MEIPGLRRNYEDGIQIIDGPIRVTLFADCLVLSAHDDYGMARLNCPTRIESYLKGANNVITYEDAMGATHLIEIYFNREAKGLEVNT